ncbi:MAG TPA: YggT family protein [Woeseiaceae bacterium]|nr:YggT family protein [Woeseiaceae bacterium]
MGNSASSAIVFIINSLAQLYLLVLLLRFLLPWLGISFNNPISQGILRLTSPLVIPVRRLLPAIGKIDTATLVVAFGIQYLTIFVITLILGRAPSLLPIAITAVVDLVILALRLFVFAIIIRIILSWVGGAAGGYNPAVAIVGAITEPVLRPFRRFIPPLGGIDISPVFAIILLSGAAILISGLKQLPY